MMTPQERELMSSLSEGSRQYGDYLMECREILDAHDEGYICDATALRMFKNAVRNQLTED
jgi:hypothetical protein